MEIPKTVEEKIDAETKLVNFQFALNVHSLMSVADHIRVSWDRGLRIENSSTDIEGAFFHDILTSWSGNGAEFQFSKDVSDLRNQIEIQMRESFLEGLKRLSEKYPIPGTGM